MKRWLIPSLISSVALTVIFVSCTPKVAPAPVPAPATASQLAKPSDVQPLSNQSPSTPQDTGWAKVVEAAQKEGSLTIYSISLTGDIGVATAKAFKDKYGITLDIISGRGAAFIERIKTEMRLGQVVADIMESSSGHTSNLKATGGTVSSLEIPILREKDIWSVDPLSSDSEGHLLVHKSYYLSPWVNTNLIKPGQEPVSYRDLAKSEWKGKILMSDPSVSESGYSIFFLMVNRGYLDIDFVRSLGGQEIKFVPGTLDVVRAVAKGEEPFGLGATDQDAGPFLSQGAPIRAIAMAEGTRLSPSAVIRVKDSPHPNAAKLFMNWILSVDGQTVFNRMAGLASVRKDVPDFRHPAAAVVPKRLIVPTEQEVESAAKAFQGKWLVELWKKR